MAFQTIIDLELMVRSSGRTAAAPLPLKAKTKTV
jgi:hypothetical protein